VDLFLTDHNDRVSKVAAKQPIMQTRHFAVAFGVIKLSRREHQRVCSFEKSLICLFALNFPKARQKNCLKKIQSWREM
jgi:hypothetical protein